MDGVAEEIERNPRVVSVVSYEDSPTFTWKPMLFHLAGKQTSKTGNASSYAYTEAKSSGFIIPGHADFLPAPAGVAHTRTLTFLKKHMSGPYFDLEAIWEEHTAFEFENRSVPNTMGTMVQEPYVNHITTVSRLHLWQAIE